MTTCPHCHHSFDPERSEAMPFCSRRCRMADLNGWFSEEYSVPVDVAKAIEDQILGEEPEENESPQTDEADEA